jgi:2-haloacid dehalogenase
VLTTALQTATAETLIGDFHDFSAHIEQALRMEIERRGLNRRGIDDALGKSRELSAFPEVPAALGRLKDESWRLAVLTNSGAEAGQHTLEAAGLASCFEWILGVDAVRAFKPHPDTYAHAASEIDTDITFVTSHAWELGGAGRAGFQTALVTRGRLRSKLFAEPDLVVADMAELADALCRS